MWKTGLLVTAALAAGGCAGSGKMEKEFPSGEPDAFEAAERREGELAGPSEDAAREATRSVYLPTDRKEARGLALSMEVPAPEVTAGTSISANMLLRNTTRNTVPVVYTDTQRFDLVVFTDKERENPVFVWSEGKFFSQIFSERMLGGGTNISEVLEVPTTPDPVSDNMLPDDLSRPLTPGTYYMWGTHAGDPYLASGPVEITVEPE